MRRGTRIRGLPVFGVAMAGLVLGHVLCYLIAFPDPHHRDLILDRAGHAYLPALGDLALIVALAGLITLSIRGLSRTVSGATERFTSLALLLGIVQVSAFAGQEVLERLVGGAPLGELLGDHILLIGAIVQVVVALAGAAALRWLARAATRLAAIVSPRARLSRPRAVVPLPASASLVDAHVVVGSVQPRAPPFL